MNKTSNMKLYGEGVFIGFATIISYLIVFLYESAYLKYYHISTEFITVNLEKVFIVFSALASFLFMLYLLLNFFYKRFCKYKNEKVRVVLMVLVGNLIFLWPFLYTKGIEENWLFLLIMFISTIVYVFVMPFIYSKKNTYVEKLADYSAGFTKNDLSDIILGFLGRNTFIFFAMIAYIFFVTNEIGLYDARKKTEFIVSTIDTKDHIIVRSYNDRTILLGIDEKNQKFGNAFMIVNTDELSKMKLENRNIGMLTYDSTL